MRVKVLVGRGVPIEVKVKVGVIVRVGVPVGGGVTVPETVKVGEAELPPEAAEAAGDVGLLLPQSQARGMAARAIKMRKRTDRFMVAAIFSSTSIEPEPRLSGLA